jgi:uncharacterized protein YajQ (UPF0234 family)
MQEMKNAIGQAMKEITTRFDLKGTGSNIELSGEEVVLTSNDEGKLKAVRDVLEGRLVKRSVALEGPDLRRHREGPGGDGAAGHQPPEGIPTEKAREIVKIIKGSKLRVQASIQGEQVRVSGKNRDDLQSVIRMLKDTDLGIDMQFTNYR